MVRINRGVDRVSEEYIVEKFRLLFGWWRRYRLIKLIMKLYIVVLVHSV